MPTPQNRLVSGLLPRLPARHHSLLSGCVPPMLPTSTTCFTPAALAASICSFCPSQSTFSGCWSSFHVKDGLAVGGGVSGWEQEGWGQGRVEGPNARP
jgi:hypothetical protein